MKKFRFSNQPSFLKSYCNLDSLISFPMTSMSNLTSESTAETKKIANQKCWWVMKKVTIKKKIQHLCKFLQLTQKPQTLTMSQLSTSQLIHSKSTISWTHLSSRNLKLTAESIIPAWWVGALSYWASKLRKIARNWNKSFKLELNDRFQRLLTSLRLLKSGQLLHQKFSWTQKLVQEGSIFHR